MKDKLQKVHEFLIRNRRSGTTSLIKQIKKTIPINVVVANQNVKNSDRDYRNDDNVYSYQNLERAIGKNPLPILFDNCAMLYITHDCIRTISDLEKKYDNDIIPLERFKTMYELKRTVSTNKHLITNPYLHSEMTSQLKLVETWMTNPRLPIKNKNGESMKEFYEKTGLRIIATDSLNFHHFKNSFSTTGEMELLPTSNHYWSDLIFNDKKIASVFYKHNIVMKSDEVVSFIDFEPDFIEEIENDYKSKKIKKRKLF